jgi:hypothetical protein
MILLILAVVSSINSQAGCRSYGATVYCELAPPVPALPAAPVMLVRTQAKHVARSKHLQKELSQSASNRGVEKDALTEEDIGQHVAALVSIEDCTGARNFAKGVGATELAQRTFDTCIGLKPDPPQTREGSKMTSETVADAKWH